ncbi:recombinase family protein [Bacillus sp. FDAARGOS_1420]|uniref:recombinase family protein n=1 Tax=unclassified Bacillus (in: firmicutes) TaxID=185979 RepID=UPI001C5B7806|nr:recombinase family protein [Bacillus sp. FDAARGOS_1420]MBW3493218.1 recombinase family protein [Bacillus sp. FDAARGOS_1420]
MKCAIYRRVSTDMQAEKGSSLEAQKERLCAFAISQGWEVASDYIDDGYSAKDMNRPALQRMLSNMREKQFDIILVYKLDRLCRSVRDLNDMIKEFEKYQVKFKSSTESLDTTTATGRMMINIIGTLAQWEREQTAERVSMILNERSKKGLWNGGPMPYGYLLKDSVVTVIKEEEKIVQFCFNKAITHGAQAIAKILNEQGYRTRDGHKWLMRSILRMLHNPLYKGYVTYEKDGKTQLAKVNIQGFKSIITEELFDKVQYIIKKRTLSPTRVKNDSIFPFSGILICPKCGGKMSGTTITTKGTQYKYYRCSKVVHGVCDQQLINEHLIDSEFSKTLISIFKDLKINSVSNHIDKNSIEKQLKALEGKRIRTKELYIEGELKRHEYDEKIRMLNDKKESLIYSLENANNKISQEVILNIISEMQNCWRLWPDEAKAKIMRGIFDEIYFNQLSKKELKIIDYKFI